MGGLINLDCDAVILWFVMNNKFYTSDRNPEGSVLNKPSIVGTVAHIRL